MYIRFLVFCLFFAINSISADAHNYYIIDGAYEDNSVVKLWYTMIGLLDDYDTSRCSGFEISFNGDGKHYDATRGPNWWDYYFAFHAVGSAQNSSIVRVPRYQRSIMRFKVACTMSPERAHFLLNKYVKLQPAVQAKLEQIKKDYFSQDVPVVGVYYQKPIMPGVQPSWDPVMLADRVQQEIRELGDCIIWLCADQTGFNEVFEKKFVKRCMRIPFFAHNACRSGAEQGEYELLTLLLLAQCDLVIAPGSYYGIGAKMLNPHLKLVQLDTIPYACE
jgi:hypothetical protein